MTAKRKKAARVRPLNLNLILWFAFLLFAVLLILLFLLVQNIQMTRRYRDGMVENLREAGKQLTNLLTKDVKQNDVGKIMLSVANRYNVSACLCSEDGDFVYPDIPGEEEEYRDTFEIVRNTLDGIKPDENRKVILSLTNDEVGICATVIDLWGDNYYLYLSSSFATLNAITADMQWFTLITGLFGVALSFVAGGFLAMVITKPVSEVTERAKRLARGDFEPNDGKTYFCAEVNDLSRALDYAGTEISKTDRMQKELIANVSHDFKTPLTMIKAYAAMIREISGEDPAKRARHAEIIIDEADRLTALVEDLLDLSRLEAGTETLERTVFNLSEEVYKVAGRFGYLIDTKGYTLDTEIDDELYAYAAKERVDQVLYNLIGNAFNYTGEDKKVVVRLKKGEGFSRFEVEDSGEGIPESEIETIWERYYSSSGSHTRPVKGTGLGLSIVKNVLLRYNIPFGVTSEVGKGSCFYVEFPSPPDDLDDKNQKRT